MFVFGLLFETKMEILMPKVKIVSFLISAAVGTFLANTGFAQNAPYATVKGWAVASAKSNGALTGCTMSKTTAAGRLTLIKFTSGKWRLFVPTRQSGTFGGGIVSYDKADVDSQFGFSRGSASRDMSADEISRFKAGREFGVQINGDAPLSWALTGSTAAALKVDECVSNKGIPPAAKAQTTRPQAQRPNSQSGARPSAQAASGPVCWTVTSGTYDCVYEEYDATGRFSREYALSPKSGDAPAFDIRVASEQDVEVNVWFGTGPWQYMGIWQAVQNVAGAPAGAECIEPASNQTAEARNNLGQDAWVFCAR
ncbi:hypothetical protein [Candidatus Rhodobacter oscarellae]|uniref:hypothetical protein n=1 Tax=Candidatus Rhodobacter oscarellae TaxID=1675527 RepID=UPI00128FA024|nr:hypothetical protein [Candidatus Rhodobacter lobularis]